MGKVYLAGPMRGIPEFNFPAFHAAAKLLRNRGWEVFSPAENDLEVFGRDPSKGNTTGDEKQFAKEMGVSDLELRRRCFAVDTKWICEHADAIALLPGWTNSKGACAELALAEALGLRVIFLAESDYAVAA